jgi:hypothetical protein
MHAISTKKFDDCASPQVDFVKSTTRSSHAIAVAAMPASPLQVAAS